ncbi:MAG: hypothetical protein IPJ08_25155 [Burkholderiales bacterium]|nr:hypothetical protein [Burkholderiales bacterium]
MQFEFAAMARRAIEVDDAQLVAFSPKHMRMRLPLTSAMRRLVDADVPFKASRHQLAALLKNVNGYPVLGQHDFVEKLWCMFTIKKREARRLS